MALQLDRLSDSVWVLHDGSNSIAEIDGANNVIRLNGTVKLGANDISTELAALDGVTATATELNTLAGVTPGTVTAGKAIVTTTSKHIDALAISEGGLAIGAGAGTAVTSSAAELNKLDGVTATTTEINTLAGGTAVGKATKTIAYADFTDGGAAVGTYDIATGIVPAGAFFLWAIITAATGFTGDTTAVLTIGDGTDVDRYNTGTIDVFSDLTTGVGVGDPSGTRYHATAKTPRVTVTKGTDWGAGTTGSVTVELYWLT
jgi:hypothetical protein